MNVKVNSPATIKLITVLLGVAGLIVGAYVPAAAPILNLLGPLLVGGGAVSVVRKP